MTEQTPSISIDDALRLFLQFIQPSGLADGPEKDALLEHMRTRVADDRPEWAAASEPPVAPPPPPEASSDYARTKAAIVTAAQAPEIPTDPLERAVWEDRQKAHVNAEQRRADADEDQTRERLRRRAIDEERAFDDVTIERALRIRRMLEVRLASLASDQVQAPSLDGLGKLAPAIEPSSIEFSQPREPDRVSFTIEERVELMRAYNAERRALLQHRDDVIGRRGIDHRDDSDDRMRMSTDGAPRETQKDKSLTFDSTRSSKRTRTWDLQLD